MLGKGVPPVGRVLVLPSPEAAIAAKSHFEARDDDVLLASSMKTGSTWLKALIPSILSFEAEDDSDPLLKNHPNNLMPSFTVIFRENPNPDLSGMASPRLFRTHIPYTMLPESVKNSGCKIVYITRDPKDTFISLWHFLNKDAQPEDGYYPYPMTETFDKFCQGVHPFGPFHDHVLSYWNESLKRPEKILFLKYEEMKRDTKGQVKKLASFLGRPSLKDEELDKIVWRCSFDRLKNLDVNKYRIDPFLGTPYSPFFRLGIVGDWKNNLTAEMKERLDEITRNKLEGSGLFDLFHDRI